MSNIAKAFANGKAFIPFITCGDPDLETTAAAVRAMAANGADLIELGIPFSDPTAEGPVIQGANIRALKAGTTTDKVFDFVREVRKDVSIPMVFMTYANVVFSYSAERFISTCAEIGIDGLILDGVPRGRGYPCAVTAVVQQSLPVADKIQARCFLRIIGRVIGAQRQYPVPADGVGKLRSDTGIHESNAARARISECRTQAAQARHIAPQGTVPPGAQALDGFRAKMIAVRVGDKDILHAVQYMRVIAMLRIVKHVRTGINQQIAIDQHRRESPMKNAGCVGVNVPVRRAGSEKG